MIFYSIKPMFLLLREAYYNGIPFEKHTGQTDLSPMLLRLTGKVGANPSLVFGLLSSSIINNDDGLIRYRVRNINSRKIMKLFN